MGFRASLVAFSSWSTGAITIFLAVIFISCLSSFPCFADIVTIQPDGSITTIYDADNTGTSNTDTTDDVTFNGGSVTVGANAILNVNDNFVFGSINNQGTININSNINVIASEVKNDGLLNIGESSSITITSLDNGTGLWNFGAIAISYDSIVSARGNIYNLGTINVNERSKLTSQFASIANSGTVIIYPNGEVKPSLLSLFTGFSNSLNGVVGTVKIGIFNTSNYGNLNMGASGSIISGSTIEVFPVNDYVPNMNDCNMSII